MSAGKDGEGENCGVDGRKVPAGTVRDTGGEDDGGDGEDLDGRVDFPEHRRAEAAETRDDVDCRSANKQFRK